MIIPYTCPVKATSPLLFGPRCQAANASAMAQQMPHLGMPYMAMAPQRGECSAPNMGVPSGNGISEWWFNRDTTLQPTTMGICSWCLPSYLLEMGTSWRYNSDRMGCWGIRGNLRKMKTQDFQQPVGNIKYPLVICDSLLLKMTIYTCFT
jgi:hypothetical protein